MSNYDVARSAKTEIPDFPTAPSPPVTSWRSKLEPPIVHEVEDEEEKNLRLRGGRRRRRRRRRKDDIQTHREPTISRRRPRVNITREPEVHKSRRDTGMQVHIPRVSSIGTSTIVQAEDEERTVQAPRVILARSPSTKTFKEKSFKKKTFKRKKKIVLPKRRKTVRRRRPRSQRDRLSTNDRNSLIEEMGRLTGFLLRNMKKKRTEKIERRKRLLQRRTFRSSRSSPSSSVTSRLNESSSSLPIPPSPTIETASTTSITNSIQSPGAGRVPELRKRFSEMIEKIESLGSSSVVSPPEDSTTGWNSMVQAIEKLEPKLPEPAIPTTIALYVKIWLQNGLFNRLEIRLPLDLVFQNIMQYLYLQEKKEKTQAEDTRKNMHLHLPRKNNIVLVLMRK